MLDATIENGTIFKYLISLDNGEFIISDTITRVFGTEIEIFYDDGETIENWTTQKWDNTDDFFYSPSYSITDSPNGDYNHGENSIITLDTTISLKGASIAFLRFWAKWEIEAGYDYVQLSAKEEGSNTWVSLHGRYSSYGNYYLDSDDPVYDGVQDEWVNEEVSLADFVDKNMTLRFRFYSDDYVKGDGFYFDDLSVSVISTITNINTNQASELFVSEAYPNPTFDGFKIQYNLNNAGQAIFELFNLSGNRIKSIDINNKMGILNIDISNLPDGIYYYRLTNGNKVSETSKLIKL
jgi:hypothetical protein